MPIPPKAETISLDGTEFGLDIPGKALYRESYYTKYPQKTFPDSDNDQFWREWTTRSFHGGERQERILSEDDLLSFRYHDAEGLDQALLSEWGQLKLCSSITRTLTIQSPSLPMTVSADGTTLYVGLDESPFIKLWTSAGGWANPSAVAGSGTVTDLVTAGATLYAVRGGAVLTSTNAGANWTAVGSYTTAVGVAVVNGELFVGKSDGVYNHTDSVAITTEPVTVIAGYRENLYAGKDRRLFRWDGRAWYLYDELPTGFNMTCLYPYRDVLLILGYFKTRSGYRGAAYYIKGASENHLYSLGTSATVDYRIYAAAGGDDEIFFANPVRGGADRYGLEEGGLTNGPIWGAAGAIPFKAMAVCEGYLFIGRYDAVAGTDGVWYADLLAPSAYKTSGWLTTSEYDFGLANQVKLFKEVYIEHRALVTGQSFNIDYSLDGGSTYTDLGTSDTVGATSKTLTMSAVTGNSIKLKINVAGPGTSTPTLTKVVVRAAACTEAKYMWDLNILVFRKWGGSTSLAALWTAVGKQTQLTFLDRDGTSYNVIIDAMAENADPDPQRDTAHVKLRLRQI